MLNKHETMYNLIKKRVFMSIVPMSMAAACMRLSQKKDQSTSTPPNGTSAFKRKKPSLASTETVEKSSSTVQSAIRSVQSSSTSPSGKMVISPTLESKRVTPIQSKKRKEPSKSTKSSSLVSHSVLAAVKSKKNLIHSFEETIEKSRTDTQETVSSVQNSDTSAKTDSPVPTTPEEDGISSPIPKSPAAYHGTKFYETATSSKMKKVLKQAMGKETQTIGDDEDIAEDAELIRINYSQISKSKKSDPDITSPIAIKAGADATIEVEKDGIVVKRRGSIRKFDIHRQTSPTGEIHKSLFPKSGDGLVRVPGSHLKKHVQAFRESPKSPHFFKHVALSLEEEEKEVSSTPSPSPKLSPYPSPCPSPFTLDQDVLPAPALAKEV